MLVMPVYGRSLGQPNSVLAVLSRRCPQPKWRLGGGELSQGDSLCAHAAELVSAGRGQPQSTC